MTNLQSNLGQQTTIKLLRNPSFSPNFSGNAANNNSATNVATAVNFSNPGGNSGGLGSSGGGGGPPTSPVHNYRPLIPYTPPMIGERIDIYNHP